ncbi:GvpL/GvpF family gas vesicle protein [Alteribacillus sp. YIM 98480]|uniref:GvpL/GvpF family gas vesicle protein n=1 Tax=Alteribacillus sp. YIM 98480 TaxID=2606599 RepID=UPI00131AE43C|nr:GvpL/GvpF family gas vesicle protein [Alteribacillus sp. YIM 98480]
MDVSAQTDTLIYLYAFIPRREYEQTEIDSLEGIEAPYEVEFISFKEITAAVTKVPEEEYSEANLQKNVENLRWLQEKAYHHHNLMNQLHTHFTVLPLKFGTIHETKSRLEKVVENQDNNILTMLEQLKNKEEWNVKIYADKDQFVSSFMENDSEVKKKKEEINQLSPGKQFFAKKKMNEWVDEKAKADMISLCEKFHEKLAQYSMDTELKKNWEKKITGRKEEMCWNSVYLLKKNQKEQFLDCLQSKKEEAEKGNTGLIYEITGPWPAYHFSQFKE